LAFKLERAETSTKKQATLNISVKDNNWPRIRKVCIMPYTNFQEHPMLPTAKVFTTGRSQAVRLPREFRFDVAQVFVRRDPLTGDVVLSRKPSDWQGLLDAVALNQNDDLLLERRQTSTRRDPFEGLEE
jgi:antitoxin VapB